MNTITIVSLMAENARPLYRAIAGYLREQAGLPATLVEDAPWQQQERMLDRGEADVGFLCGLLYTQKADKLELLAAPVMAAARYESRPVYFSDIIVRRDSRFGSFASLRGAGWAFNDPGSFSGYAVLRAHLAALGETGAFCGRLAESGGHLRSIDMVLAGAADAAAIDSIVLDLEMARRPELAGQLRVVASLGPSTAPPAAVGRHVPAEMQARLRAALLGMHATQAGRQALEAGRVARFVGIHDFDYNDLRTKARDAATVAFRLQ